jgi:2-oxoglutarate/2-oxoacid ferredoxin oxidoreductase subunit alpha
MATKIVNECSIRVATVNGTGSQSSNNLLYKSLFRMGIGVCAKNLFPSNIQGLPTWYQIRASQKGYQNLREHDDIAVLMNAETSNEDIASMRPGTTIFYNSSIIKFNEDQIKPGMHMYALPVEELAKGITDAKLRNLLKNLFYVGALSHLYAIDIEVMKGVIKDTFRDKQSAIDANVAALEIGIKYAQENYKKTDNFYFERAETTKGKISMEGNSASALGSIYAGCTVCAWYPITPSSSLAEAFEAYAKKMRVGKDGKNNYAVVQAEDELSSIGMVIGASWAGARAMTSTSGPGISLMSEFIGLAYYSEVPAVIYDVQRVGPSTGLPTRTQQCDIQMCAIASHGDTKHIMLFPSSPKECFELAGSAFELAEHFQTPVFVMTDLDLGMNSWVDEELVYTAPKYNRGKVLTKDQLAKMDNWGRYNDIDKDGVCYRTLPGTDHMKAAYFNRGSGHDEFARYTESPVVYARNMDRLLRKWHTAKKHVPKPVITGDAKAKVGVIAYGTTHHAMVEALDRLKGTPIRYLRLKGYPFSDEVEQFIKECDTVYVVEQNRDGQLRQLIDNDLPGYQSKIKSIRYYAGFPISSDVVERELKNNLGKA